jgi:hypothetical protein
VWHKQAQSASNRYEGDYHNGLKHGTGQFWWASGGHYVGGYCQDLKSGYGVMTWADGSQYWGYWKDGVQNGLGLIKFANGETRAGIFSDNTLINISPSHEDLTAPGHPAEFITLLNEYYSQSHKQ